MLLIDEIWYSRSFISHLCRIPLYPFAWLFRLVSAVRRRSYTSDPKKTKAPPIPIIVVGGLSAGGSGKTPLCAAMITELKKRGYNPGLLSRGYKGRVRDYPYLLDESTQAFHSGDEPLLIYRQCGCKVVVDPDRIRGAYFLYENGVDIIVCDDGLQHYRLARDVEIAVLDGARMLGNGHLLPAGPLREGQWRLQSVDAVVVNGVVARPGNYAMIIKPDQPKSLNGNDQTLSAGSRVGVLAGIGNPKRFYKTVEDLGFSIGSIIKAADHEKVSVKRIEALADDMPVLMTRKDAVKYDDLKIDNVFVVDIKAYLSTQFYDLVEDKIKSVKESIARRDPCYRGLVSGAASKKAKREKEQEKAQEDTKEQVSAGSANSTGDLKIFKSMSDGDAAIAPIESKEPEKVKSALLWGHSFNQEKSKDTLTDDDKASWLQAPKDAQSEEKTADKTGNIAAGIRPCIRPIRGQVRRPARGQDRRLDRRQDRRPGRR